MWSDYLFPTSLEGALEMLVAHDGRARIIAGGTDLVLQAQRGQCPSSVMVDITSIPNLAFLEEREGWICVGPTVTHAQVAASPLVRERAGVLASACASVGGPQIRQVGTLVGNVVNALPAADGAVALFALDAQVHVLDCSGSRWLPIASFYKGVGQCAADPCHEIVTALRFRPLQGRTGWSFRRLARRRALILPTLCTAIVVGVEDGLFADARLAVGPVAPIPLRVRSAEGALLGAPAAEPAIAEAARRAQQAADPRDSILRGSAGYRKQMVEVLVRRGLREALDQALGLSELLRHSTLRV
jgi:CO/xanthine dehydrogenase FAD-binding subunit